MARDFPVVVAIDLGAESCRVSLLHWEGVTPRVELVHRFANEPVRRGDSFVWDFERIFAGLIHGLRMCRERVETVDSIGVDGWAVDYVRLNSNGDALGAPYCYRDSRTEVVFDAWQQRHSRVDMFAMSGVQPLRFNTMFQLMADQDAGAVWVNLPEYVLMRLGGRRIAEYTNATHTGMVDLQRKKWNAAIFALCGLEMSAAPELVATGSDIGVVTSVAGFERTRLIAVACHDTASAVAAIPMVGDDWAYISSGTWSLVGTLVDAPITTREALEAGFTNLGAAGGRICFHRNVNGMWLLRQTMSQICLRGEWSVEKLVNVCATMARPDVLLDVDDDALLLPDLMASRINAQLASRGMAEIEESAAAMPQFANLIFHSLSVRYAEVLRDVERHTGKKLRKVVVIGGGSLNLFLNELTAKASGLEVIRGATESSTLGNFSIQLATMEGRANVSERIAHWAGVLRSMTT